MEQEEKRSQDGGWEDLGFRSAKSEVYVNRLIDSLGSEMGCWIGQQSNKYKNAREVIHLRQKNGYSFIDTLGS